MNLGDLYTTLGVDASPLRKAEGEMQAFGRSAESTFSKAGSAADFCANHIAGIIGVTLSVAGAFALANKAVSSWYSAISDGINKVEKFKSEMISTSYLLAAQSKVEKPDLGKAYEAWGNYYQWMKQQALEADKAAASGMEDIMAVATQLLKKGVKAENLEEFNVIARLTDVMKGAIPGYANLAMQARGEIEAMLNGINRMGAQTAMILSGIDPEFKKNMANARATGKELEYFNKLLPQIEQYTRDMMGTLDAVTSSLRAAYSVVQVQAFGNAHKDIVKFIGDLGNKLVENGKLTAQGQAFAAALGQTWARTKVAISEAVDYLLKNLPAIVDKLGDVITGVSNFVSWSVNAAIATAKWVNENIVLIKTFAEFLIITKATAWMQGLVIALTAAGSASTILAGIVGGLQIAIGSAAYTTTVFSSAGAGMTTAMTTMSGAAIALNAAMMSLAPALLAAAGAMGVYGAYKTMTEPGKARSKEESAVMAGVPGLEYVGGRTDKQVEQEIAAEFVGPAAPSPLQRELQKQQENVDKLLSGKAPPTPGLRPPGGKEEKGGKGGGADAEINRLNSLFDTLTKDIARLSEGKLAEIEANYVKTVEQIYKKSSDRAHSEAEVEILAKQRATLQKEKLQDEFDLKMTKGSGDAFVELKEQYDKDIRDYNGLAGAKERIDAYYNRQRIMKEVDRATEVLNLQKQNIDTMAGLAPMLEDQLELKRRSLDIENELAKLAITKLVNEKPYLSHLEDELRLQQAMVAQAKKYNLERENWMREGIGGGLKAGAMDRSKVSETRLATWTIEAATAAESYIGETGGQAFIDIIHGAKTDFMKMFSDIGDSFIKQLFKMGTTKLFDTVWGVFLDKGPGKLGTEGNPMVVRVTNLPGLGKGVPGAGEPDFAKKAGKIGFTSPGMGAGIGEVGSGLGGYTKLMQQAKQYDKLDDTIFKEERKETKTLEKENKKLYNQLFGEEDAYQQMIQERIDLNQESFKSNYINQYQTDFTGMTTGITSIWGTAQGIMTAAGVQGDSQRIASMAGFAMQAVGIIVNLAKSNILAKAWEGAASAYASAMAGLPFPINAVVAPIYAAATFVAISAMGAMGGSIGGGGGGTGLGSGGMTSTGAGYTEGYHTGGHLRPIRAHAGFPPLKSGEVPFIGLDSERVLSPQQTYDYEAGLKEGAQGRMNSRNNSPIIHAPITFAPVYNYRPTQADMDRDAKMMVKAINKTGGVGTRGQKLGSGRY